MSVINVRMKVLNATGTTINPATEESLGTDGASPPSIPGTGVRGWLRALYDRSATAAKQLPDGHSVSVIQLPATLGQKVSSASLPAVLSTEQEAILVLRNNPAATLLNLLPSSSVQKTLRITGHGANQQFSYNVRAAVATLPDAASHEVMRQRRIGPSSALTATYSRSGATVTVTTTTAHNLLLDDLIYHTGATDTGLNGYARVTVTGATTYTFTTAATGAATGAITVQPMGDEFRYRSGVALTALEAGW